jgi:hypothetical protein
MKSSDSTEIDRLLRRHARLGGGTLPSERSDNADIQTAIPGVHLDADEMNAYAEGALPEAARSRYFAHLADCDSCRKLVTDLTLAAVRSDEGKARVASLVATPSKSWREWLAAIFSPPVLRYGVPAVALFAVIIVAIVAMRTQRKEADVAMNTEQSRYPSSGAPATSTSSAENTTSTGTTESHANSNAAPRLMEEQGQPRPDVAATPAAKSVSVEDAAPVASQEPVNSPVTTETDDAKTRAGEFGVAGKRGQQPEVAAPPPPAPVPQPTVLASPPAAADASARDDRDEQKKDKAARKDEAEGRTVSGTIARESEAKQSRQPLATTSNSPQPQSMPRSKRSAAAKSGPPTDDNVEERSAETRSVSGRRFHRQGSAWVDTAYNSSRPTTNVARGSEQYRALVADEPGLRVIAEQLGGQVIVVWKSRSYRFY